MYTEIDSAAESRQFNCVQTPVDMFDSVSAESHVLEYTRLPIIDDAAPAETVRNAHRRRRRDRGRGHAPLHPPPPRKKNRGKYFSGNYHVKLGHFSDKCHVKFGNFVTFSGKYH